MPWQDHFTRDELLVRIRRLAAKGLRQADVADVIGRGVTVGIVAGMARRAKPRIVFGGDAPGTSNMLSGFVILSDGDDDSGSVHFDDLRAGDGRCRYPLWPDRIGTAHRPQSFELRVCGKPVVDGTSWCPDCTRIVFEQKPKEKRPDRTGRRQGWHFGT